VLLESMLKDFARARVICRPPEPISVLQTAVNTENVRSLLVHAADLAECLDDASVLTEAQQVVPMYSPDSHERPPFKEAPSGLVSLIVDARYRLMMEQIGRDLLKYSNSEYDDPIWERPAQYLGDVALLESIRSGREEFKEERSETIRTRGDSGDPGACQRAVLALVTSARDRLRAQLPGLTKQEETRERLFELVENQVTEILSKGRIEDQWDYIILKHFSSYPDMRRFLYDKDRPKAQAMLKYFETPI